MKFTLNWLKDYLNTDAKVDEISKKLTNLGIEVESVDDFNEIYKNFIVGHVLECNSHPNADKLSLLKVSDGKSCYEIVCGAQNVRAGLKVALAKIGAIIPSTKTILEKGIIRGIESCGMLCSASELSLDSLESDEKSSGILELDNDLVPGTALSEALGINDVVFDVTITPNRGDAMNVYGIARDLAASGIGRLKLFPSSNLKSNLKLADTDILQIYVSEKVQEQDCPYFSIICIKDVNNTGKLLKKIESRLLMIGQNLINPIVDIANYISIDIGQPLHVYDLDLISHYLELRYAEEGETVLCLDGKTYKLSTDILVTSDKNGVLGIAGVLGGERASVTRKTKNILIESAYFDQNIMPKFLPIHSSSKSRFERGIDPKAVLSSNLCAASLILKNCGGKHSWISEIGKPRLEEKKIELKFSSIKRMLGNINFSMREAVYFLQKLGCSFDKQSSDSVIVIIPSHRHDIKIEEDLIEEIIRLYGFDQIGMQSMNVSPILKTDIMHEIRKYMVLIGYTETVSCSIVDFDIAKKFIKGEEVVKLKAGGVMRSSILINLLQILQNNLKRGTENISLFELSRSFKKLEDKTILEEKFLSGVKMGDICSQVLLDKKRPISFFDVKSDVEFILKKFNVISKLEVDSETPNYFHPTRSARIFRDTKTSKETIGYIGEIHPDILDFFDIPKKVVAFELKSDLFLSISKSSRCKISPYQQVKRDFSFVLDKNTKIGYVLDIVEEIGKDIIKNISVFDVYEGSKLPDDKKSVAFEVTIQSMDKTFTEKDLLDFQNKIVSAIQEKCNGILRINF